jgi:hypothetical protein
MPKFYEGFADEIAVPSGKRDVQVSDDELPGFGIRKFSSGQKAYFVKYNIGFSSDDTRLVRWCVAT